MKRGVKIFIMVVLGVILIGGAGFVLWASAAAPASAQAAEAAQSSPLVSVELRNGWQVFRPAQSAPQTGFIFYPGGRVSFQAYAPLLRPLAEKGTLVVVPPMPLNLAIFGVNTADQIMASYPEIKHWAIGGHSLGGSMAASYARAHPAQIQGLVLWASYPAGSDDLSAASLRVVSIFGTRDGLATREKIDSSKVLLPATTRWVSIEGGNHAQFGSYGSQVGDLLASISPQTQWNLVTDATLTLLQEIGK